MSPFLGENPLKPSHKRKSSRDLKPKILQSGERPEVLGKYLGFHCDNLKTFQVKSNSHYQRDIQALAVMSQEKMSLILKKYETTSTF